MKQHTMNMNLSILIIAFTATCLFTFASIVLASVKQTKLQADAIVSKQTDYYMACNKAADTIKKSITKNGEYNQSFIINDDETLFITYTVKDKTYKIKKWQTVDTSDWTPDAHLNLINQKK